MRVAKIHRKTKETDIAFELNLDGKGEYEIDTSIPFLDHMLSHVAVHGLLDLTIRARGDLEIGPHHTVEDVGIVFGQALSEALGDKISIARYSSQVIPMDEALVLLALDISGRGLLALDVIFPQRTIGSFDCHLVGEFLRSLATSASLTLHVKLLSGQDSHHIAEAIFKALGRAIREATSLEEGRKGVPSTKGVL